MVARTLFRGSCALKSPTRELGRPCCAKSKMDGVRKNYANKISQDIANEGMMYEQLSKIRRVQNLFKPGDVPVHLLGKSDLPLYRGVMVGSLIGIGITLATLGLMATNNLSKKK